ncbi:MAG: tight adherence protein C [Hyphomicrobiaceae bacterium]|jgi:tight adherence protein C
MSLPLLIAAMVFIGTISLMLGVLAQAEKRRGTRFWKERVTGASSREDDEAEQSSATYLSERLAGLLERLGQLSQSKSKSQTEISALRKTLVIAGYRAPSAPMTFVGVKLVLALGLPAIAVLMPNPALAGMEQMHRLVLYVGLGVAGIYVPELWLSRMAARRRLKITDGFPDSLDLLVVCVEAGLGLDAAIHRTGTELAHVHPELAGEFHLLTLELRAGMPRSQALVNLGDRVDVDEIRSFVALLIQTDRFGTSIGQSLRVHSDAMRTQRALRAEEKAGKLPVKMLFPLMFFIFPSLFIVILGPAIIQGVRVLLPALATN